MERIEGTFKRGLRSAALGFVGFCATSSVLRPFWRILEIVVFYGASLRGVELNFAQTEDKKRVYALISDLRRSTTMLGVANNEAYQIYSLVRSSLKNPGSLAEVGVYQGGSARIICEAKGDRPLYLFDTFEGLPETSDIDTTFEKGQYVASYEAVKALMEPFENVYIFKGLFPDTAEGIKDETFTFVNLDVDTYASTLSCLEYFYSRMTKGGMILSHDYATAAGVKQAFSEFFQDRPETIIEVAGSQCLVVRG